MCSSSHLELPDERLFGDVGRLIGCTRECIANVVNSELVMLYWSIGERVREDVLLAERADCGERIVADLAEKLTAKHGRGYDRSSLMRMQAVAAAFPDKRTVVKLSQRATWSHLVRLAAIEDRLEREFYTLVASRERWSARTLRAQIDAGLYQRAIATSGPVNPLESELAAARESGLSTPDLVLRDPYALEFLGLPEKHGESGLERAIPCEREIPSDSPE